MTATDRIQAVKRGRWAEWLCVCVVVLSGWRVLVRGMRRKRGTGVGEVDLVACRGHVLAFIEVKARPTLDRGLTAVSQEQRTRIARGAEVFIAAHGEFADYDVRFDVMVVRPWRWPTRVIDAWRPSC